MPLSMCPDRQRIHPTMVVCSLIIIVWTLVGAVFTFVRRNSWPVKGRQAHGSTGAAIGMALCLIHFVVVDMTDISFTDSWVFFFIPATVVAGASCNYRVWMLLFSFKLQDAMLSKATDPTGRPKTDWYFWHAHWARWRRAQLIVWTDIAFQLLSALLAYYWMSERCSLAWSTVFLFFATRLPFTSLMAVVIWKLRDCRSEIIGVRCELLVVFMAAVPFFGLFFLVIFPAVSLVIPWIAMLFASFVINLNLVWIPPLRSCRKQRAVMNEKRTLDRLLSSPRGIVEFAEFLRSEFSAENLAFWLETGLLLQLKSVDPAALSAMYSLYITFDSMSTINISSSIRNSLAVAIQPYNDIKDGRKAPIAQDLRLALQAARDQIYGLMDKDSFPRFLAHHCSGGNTEDSLWASIHNTPICDKGVPSTGVFGSPQRSRGSPQASRGTPQPSRSTRVSRSSANDRVDRPSSPTLATPRHAYMRDSIRKSVAE